MAAQRHTNTGEGLILGAPRAWWLLHTVLGYGPCILCYDIAVLRTRLSLLVACRSVTRRCWGRTTARSPWQTGLATGTSTSSSTSGGSSGW